MQTLCDCLNWELLPILHHVYDQDARGVAEKTILGSRRLAIRLRKGICNIICLNSVEKQVQSIDPCLRADRQHLVVLGSMFRGRRARLRMASSCGARLDSFRHHTPFRLISSKLFFHLSADKLKIVFCAKYLQFIFDFPQT